MRWLIFKAGHEHSLVPAILLHFSFIFCQWSCVWTGLGTFWTAFKSPLVLALHLHYLLLKMCKENNKCWPPLLPAQANGFFSAIFLNLKIFPFILLVHIILILGRSKMYMDGLGLPKQIPGKTKKMWIFVNNPWQHAFVWAWALDTPSAFHTAGFQMWYLNILLNTVIKKTWAGARSTRSSFICNLPHKTYQLPLFSWKVTHSPVFLSENGLGKA